jgi:hypothetical protein
MTPLSRPLRLLRYLMTYALFLWGITGSETAAQLPKFDSGSNGSDGALDLSNLRADGGGLLFDPTTFDPPLDADGDNIYHFTTIDIPSGVTVHMPGPVLNMRPVYWLATGDVTINGTIDLDGEDGDPLGSYRLAMPGAGGNPGGVAQVTLGGVGTLARIVGFGPGAPSLSSSRLGAAHFSQAGGHLYGNTLLVPLLGGSGGNTRTGSSGGGGAGAGGGALLIASSTSIALGGMITARGGAATRVPQSTLIGGGGSGGAVHLKAPTVTGSGTIDISGGRLPSSSTSSDRGSQGRVRIEAFTHGFAGSGSGQVLPDSASLSRGVPTPVLVPAWSVVRIVSVDGQAISPSLDGTLAMPMATVTTSGQVELGIEAHNVDPGTRVRIHFVSSVAQPDSASSTPLAGTFARSTATATATIPGSLSQVIIRYDQP